jgi:hypothetical protein
VASSVNVKPLVTEGSSLNASFPQKVAFSASVKPGNRRLPCLRKVALSVYVKPLVIEGSSLNASCLRKVAFSAYVRPLVIEGSSLNASCPRKVAFSAYVKRAGVEIVTNEERQLEMVQV